MTLAGIAPNPEVEVPDKAQRRRFTAQFKRDILKRADACKEPGALGAMLRAEGLYSSHLAGARLPGPPARERAGLAPAPTSQELTTRPAAERFWRMRLALGDDYEDMLARKLGATRARALRGEHDGWAGKAVFTGQCEPGADEAAAR